MVLVAVDFQNDSCLESGTLYVPKASIALWNIESLLNSGKVSKVIFTVDWHPENRCSFKDNGGELPAHCV